MHSLVASPALWTPHRLAPYAWYRADFGITLVGSKVSAWGDQSGNGNHLTQSSDPLRPTYVTSVPARGNCPAVAMGSGLFLETTITLPRELSIVLALGTVSSTGYALAHTFGATETTYLYTGGPATFYVREIASPFYYRTVTSQPAFVSDTNMIATYDGASITVRRSGAAVSMSAPLGSPILNVDISGTLRIGASGSGAGGATVQGLEVILCPPLTAPQLAALDAYFARLGRPN